MKRHLNFSKKLIIGLGLQIFALIFAQSADVNALERLALRLLGGADTIDSSTRLLIADVPSDLPFKLALPSDTELLGSYVRRGAENALQSVQVVLDVPLSAQEALGLFDKTLQNQGWLVQLEPQSIGLLEQPSLYTAMYCSPDGSSFTYLTAFRMTSQSSDVHFDVYVDDSYLACFETDAVNELDSLQNAPLPVLTPPVDAEIEPLNDLLIVEPLSMSILLSTSLSQNDIQTHYEKQLKDAGWQALSSGESGDLSFGRWIYTDSNNLIWTTILTVMNLEENNKYYASLVVLLPIGSSGGP